MRIRHPCPDSAVLNRIVMQVRTVHAEARSLLAEQPLHRVGEQFALVLWAEGRMIEHWATVARLEVQEGRKPFHEWQVWGNGLRQDAEASCARLEARLSLMTSLPDET